MTNIEDIRSKMRKSCDPHIVMLEKDITDRQIELLIEVFASPEILSKKGSI